jgi:hypothetical protein
MFLNIDEDPGVKAYHHDDRTEADDEGHVESFVLWPQA